MTERLVLYPTPKLQWQAIISEAQLYCNVQLSEKLQMYLASLLEKHIKDQTIAEQPIATKFLESQYDSPRVKSHKLQQIGDECLLIVGLFPNRVQRRRVKISYYVKLGQTAYQALSTLHSEDMESLFVSLSYEFIALMDVLHAMRNLDKSSNLFEPLEAVELWEDTGSKSAYNFLTHLYPQTTISIKNNTKH